VSSAYGTGNFFHQLLVGAQAGANGFTPLFFPYQARPGRSADWWERLRDTYPDEALFFQEYPRDEAEAFASSVTRPLDAAYLVLGTPHVVPLPATDNPFLSPLLKLRSKRGELGFRLYQLPDPTQQYVIGADVAEGFAGGDAQAALVLNRLTGEEVAVLHGRWPIEQFAVALDLLAQGFKALLCFERNNHGTALAVYLQKHLVRRQKSRDRAERPAYSLYYERAVVTALGHEAIPQKPGWLTTARTKPLMFADLAEAFAAQDIKVASELVLIELRLLRVDLDGKIGAEEGAHDDLAIALAIGWQMVVRTHKRRPRPQVPFAAGQHTSQRLSAAATAAKDPMALFRGGYAGKRGKSAGARKGSFLARMNQKWG
jgi:hypothetical protein